MAHERIAVQVAGFVHGFLVVALGAYGFEGLLPEGCAQGANVVPLEVFLGPAEGAGVPVLLEQLALLGAREVDPVLLLDKSDQSLVARAR